MKKTINCVQAGMAGAGSRTVVRFAVWRAEVDGAERCGGVVDVQVGKCLGRDKGELFATSVSREAVWVQNISEQSDGGWQADARICASGVGVSAPGSSLLRRKFVEKKLTDVVTLHVGTRIKLGISIATVSFIGNATDASLPHDGGMMDEGEDGDEDEGEDTVAATQANSPSDEARGSAVGRMARFSGAEQGGASSVSKETEERVNSALGTKRGKRGRCGKRVGKMARAASVAEWRSSAPKAGAPAQFSSSSTSASATASTSGAAPHRSATPNDGRIKLVRKAIEKANRGNASSGVLRSLFERLRRLEEGNEQQREPRKKAHLSRKKKRAAASHARQAQKGQQRKRDKEKRRKTKTQKKMKRTTRKARQSHQRRDRRGDGGGAAGGSRSGGGSGRHRQGGRSRG